MVTKEMTKKFKESESLTNNIYAHFHSFTDDMCKMMREVILATGRNAHNIDTDVVLTSDEVTLSDVSFTADDVEETLITSIKFEYNNVYLETECGSIYCYDDISISDKLNILQGFVKYLKAVESFNNGVMRFTDSFKDFVRKSYKWLEDIIAINKHDFGVKQFADADITLDAKRPTFVNTFERGNGTNIAIKWYYDPFTKKFSINYNFKVYFGDNEDNCINGHYDTETDEIKVI